MSRSQHTPGAPTSAPKPANLRRAADVLGPREFELMWRAHQRLFDHVSRMNHLWLDSIQEATESSTQLTQRLSNCENPAQAGTICGEWLRQRGQRFLDDSRRATEMWTAFCGSLPVHAKAAADTSGCRPAEQRAAAAE